MRNALAFDLDDTLHSLRVYSLVRLKAVAHQVSADHCHIQEAPFYQRLVDDYDRGVRSDLLDRALADHGILEERYLMHLVDLYRKTPSNASLYDDTIPVIERLAEQSVPLLLFTDGDPERQRTKARHLGIDAYFFRIVCTGTSGQGPSKPCPDLLLQALTECHIAPAQLVAVGDDPRRDFVELKRHGVLTLRIRRSDGRYSRLTLDEPHEADHSITSLWEVFDHLETASDQ